MKYGIHSNKAIHVFMSFGRLSFYLLSVGEDMREGDNEPMTLKTSKFESCQQMICVNKTSIRWFERKLSSSVDTLLQNVNQVIKASGTRRTHLIWDNELHLHQM